MSEQKVPRSVEQRIVIKFLVGENVSSAEIHHRLQQQYGEECLRRRGGGWRLWLHSLKVAQLLRSAACLHTNQSRSYLIHLVLYTMWQAIMSERQMFESVREVPQADTVQTPVNPKQLDWDYKRLCTCSKHLVAIYTSVNCLVYLSSVRIKNLLTDSCSRKYCSRRAA